jgi:SpoVK/Ycf46/Vps4 family AAA+-type ATPase
MYYDKQIINNILKFFNFKKKITKISFVAEDKTASNRFRALMYYISTNCKVDELIEYEVSKYCRRTDDDIITADYRVNQPYEFNITNDIKGIIENTQVDIKSYGVEKKVIKTTLDIFSNTLSSNELIKFIEKCDTDYSKFLKEKSLKDQLYIDISWNIKEKECIFESCKWTSNINFNNKFFENKDFIINKLNFFLENKKWYQEQGIPHTIGLLLEGEPGCGKTSFIKSIANLTGYHILNFKLCEQFDFKELERIIFNEQINKDLIIPLNKRLIILEDIDCMIDIVKTRKEYVTDNSNILEVDSLEMQEIQEKQETLSSSDSKNMTDLQIVKIKPKTISDLQITKKDDSITSVIQKMMKKDELVNNNLSYLLNILDGIKESQDRIIIMTTNHVEKLDPALIRPGRIDLNINFKKASIKDIKEILNFYWKQEVSELNNSLNEQFAHANIINYCRSSVSIDKTIELLLENIKKI